MIIALIQYTGSTSSMRVLPISLEDSNSRIPRIHTNTHRLSMTISLCMMDSRASRNVVVEQDHFNCEAHAIEMGSPFSRKHP